MDSIELSVEFVSLLFISSPYPNEKTILKPLSQAHRFPALSPKRIRLQGKIKLF